MKTKSRIFLPMMALLALVMLFAGFCALQAESVSAAEGDAYALTLDGSLTVKVGGKYGEGAYYAGTLKSTSGTFYYVNAEPETGDITMRYTASEQSRTGNAWYGHARFNQLTNEVGLNGALVRHTGDPSLFFDANFAYRYSSSDHAVYKLQSAADETGVYQNFTAFVTENTFTSVDEDGGAYFGIYHNSSGMTITFDKYICYNEANDDLGIAYPASIVESSVRLYGAAGETVYVSSAGMQKGYALTGIEAADAEGSPVDLQNVQKNDDGTVSFTMPAEAVSIAPVYTDNAQPLDISGEGVTVKTGGDGAYADGPFYEIEAVWESGPGFIMNETGTLKDIYISCYVTAETRAAVSGTLFGAARTYTTSNPNVNVVGILDYITNGTSTTWRPSTVSVPYTLTMSYDVDTHQKTVNGAVRGIENFATSLGVKSYAEFDALEEYADIGKYFGIAWNGAAYSLTATRFRCYDSEYNDLGVLLGGTPTLQTKTMKALPGEKVYFTLADIEGKELRTNKIVDADGTDISGEVGLTAEGGGLYSFTMPSYGAGIVTEYADIAAERAAAVAQLEGYADAEDYRAEQQTLLTAAVAEGTQAINAADTVEGIAAALAAAKAEIDEIPTDAELTAQEVASAQQEAIAELDGYLTEDNLAKYREAQQTEVRSAVAAGKDAVNAATTVSGVNEALAEAEKTIAGIKTDAQLTADEQLAAEKTEAKEKLNKYLEDIFLADYREAQKEEIRQAVQTGIAGVERAVSSEEITAAVDSAEEAIDAIKTDAELTAEELAAAKQEATAKLEGYLTGENLVKYREAQQTKVRSAVASGKEAVNAATTVSGVNEALAEAEKTIAGIKTDAELTAEELDAAKTAAKSELNGYVDQNDYRDAEKTQVTAAVAAGNTAIDEATDTKSVAAALAAAKTAIDAIKTNAEYEAEESLAAAKTAAKELLASYVNAEDYRETQQTALQAMIAAGNAAIDAAKTTDEVNAALANAKANIDKIPTDAELSAEEGGDESEGGGCNGTVGTALGSIALIAVAGVVGFIAAKRRKG